MSNYCCKEFESHTGTPHEGFEKPNSPHTKQYNNKWHLNGCCGGGCYVLEDIKFCPFCGSELEPRYTVERANILGWMVKDTNKVVAHFGSQREAEDYEHWKNCK